MDKHKAAVVLGLILVVLGLFMQPIGSLYAKLIWDGTAPNIYSTWPAGTQDAPTPLEPAITYGYDLSCGVNDNVDSSWDITVTCAVSATGISTTTYTLTPTDDVMGYYAGHKYIDWPSPAITDLLIKFHFEAKDLTGNIAVKDAYGITGRPTADFYINNVKVTQDSIVRTSSGVVRLDIEVVSLGTYIQDAVITVEKGASSDILAYTNARDSSGTARLAKTQEGYWIQQYQLPFGEGTYTVTAKIIDTSGNEYILCILSMPWGEGGGLGFNWLQIGVIALGCVFAGYGYLKRRE